jgi:lysozyme
MIVTNFGIQLIHQGESEKMFDLSGQQFLTGVEGVKYKAYLDTGGVWTIGRGITYYEDGTKVKKGDVIDKAREEKLFQKTLNKYVNAVNELVKSNLNQNQFNALVSFCYNVGIDAFKKSTLLKKVNANPADRDIRNQFMRWIYDNGKQVPGLVNRRKKEADLYFSTVKK